MADPSRDYAAEIAALQSQIAEAQQELGRQEGAKAALSAQKAEIVRLCTALGIEPKYDTITAEITRLEAELADALSLADSLLRKIA